MEKINWNEKKLGFGLMRLPRKDRQIDIPAVCELVDAFMAKGYTYFDTAYAYAGSEVAFREAVVKRYPRDSFTVATKMPGWQLTDTLTPEVMFNEQLERCGIDYFDFYLLHSLGPSRVPFYDRNDCWNFCLQKKREGKIKHFGFSYHADPVLLDKLLTDHPEVEFVQLQINYIDWEMDAIAAKANYEVCCKHGVDVVVMEPVRGGYLADLGPEAAEVFAKLDPNATPASYAMRFAGELPGVKVVLSGMNTMEQMEDNMATFDNLVPLSEEERAAVEEVKNILLSTPTIPCTDCRYCCKDCPQNINIPEVFKAYNMYLTFGEHIRPHLYYESFVDTGSGKANSCIECGQCESVCPQHIEIISKLKEASDYLDK